MGAKYVPIFLEWLEVTQDLSAEEKGNLIDAIVSYAAGAEFEHLLTGSARIAFRFLKGQVDRNAAISDTRRQARIGKTNDNKPQQTTTNSPKEKEKDKDKEKEKEKDKRRFSPPTPEEVSAYCQERNNGIDPQRFIDYYAARGWELKPGQKVRDWKACVRTWEAHAKERGLSNAGFGGNADTAGGRSKYAFLQGTDL